MPRPLHHLAPTTHPFGLRLSSFALRPSTVGLRTLNVQLTQSTSSLPLYMAPCLRSGRRGTVAQGWGREGGKGKEAQHVEQEAGAVVEPVLSVVEVERSGGAFIQAQAPSWLKAGVVPELPLLPLVLLAVSTLAVTSVLLKAGASLMRVMTNVVRVTRINFSMNKLIVAAQYQLLQGRNMPTIGKLWTLLAFGALITFAGAIAYRSAAGADWPEALQKSYFTLNSVPGMNCTNDPTATGKLVLNCIHVFSLFTFAILVGIITDDISRAVDYLRTGNFKVAEVDHTVIIGWNKQTVHTIRHVLHRIDNTRLNDGNVFTKPILVLADRGKEEMDAELLEEFGEELLGKVLLSRQGRCENVSDMKRVSVAQARTVVWMHQGGAAEDGDYDDEGGGVAWPPRLAASLAITESLGRGSKSPQNLVLQSRVSNEEWNNDVGVIRLIGRMQNGSTGRQYKVSRVSDIWGLTEILAQCASQPGLADVFERLFIQESGNSPQVHPIPIKEFTGKSFGTARRSFAGPTTLIGIMRLGMNPPDDTIIVDDDVMIVLTMDPKNGLKPTPKPFDLFPLLPSKKVTRDLRKRHYIVVSHVGMPTRLIKSLKENLGQENSTAFTITVICNEGKDEGEEEEGIPVTYVQGDANSASLMLEAGVEKADSVVIDLMPDLTPDEADAQVLSTVLQLQGLLASSKVDRSKRLTVICCINSPEVREVLEHVEGEQGAAGVGRFLHVDCIEHDKLLGGMLTQVAASPLLDIVFQDIFDVEGNEVYAKPAEFYGALVTGVGAGKGKKWEWGELQEVVRQHGDLLVGYVDRMENVQLAVPYCSTVDLHEGDRLVVISEELY